MAWTEEDLAVVLARGQIQLIGEKRPRMPQDATQRQEQGQESREPEQRFLARVLRLLREQSFIAYHTHRSDRSAPGFSDICCTNGQRILFIELKSTSGKLTADQAIWLNLLRHTGKVEVYCWKPSDWDTVVTTMTKGPQ